MSREYVDRCNVCKTVRSDGNHWHMMVIPANSSPYFVEWNEATAGDYSHCRSRNAPIKP